MSDNARIEAMGFYHGDGFVPAFSAAQAFAGERGHLGTIPDILESRLGSHPRSAAWSSYYTTLSSEFLGRSAGGTAILIVAHGIGPLTTKEGIMAAYRHEYKDRDKNRDRSGGRVDGDVFRKLEAGAFGDVHVVDIAASLAKYEFPYSSKREEELLTDPFWLARMGGPDLVRRYLARHREVAAEEDYPVGNRPVRMGQLMNGDGSYSLVDRHEGPGRVVWFERLKEVEDGFARANLLAIGSLVNSHGDGRRDLQFDIGVHSWYDGTRFASYRETAPPGAPIHYGVERNLAADQLMAVAAHVPEDEKVTGGLEVMVQSSDDQWFVQYPKQGASMDTGAPKHRVTSIAPVQSGITMDVEQPSPFFFRYGLDSVRRIAPKGANGYALASEVRQTKGGMSVLVDFYRIEVDRSLTVPTYDEITRDYEMTMKVIAAR